MNAAPVATNTKDVRLKQRLAICGNLHMLVWWQINECVYTFKPADGNVRRRCVGQGHSQVSTLGHSIGFTHVLFSVEK